MQSLFSLHLLLLFSGLFPRLFLLGGEGRCGVLSGFALCDVFGGLLSGSGRIGANVELLAVGSRKGRKGGCQAAEDLPVEPMLAPFALDEHHGRQEGEFKGTEVRVVLTDFGLDLPASAVVPAAAIAVLDPLLLEVSDFF
jgi:hypothetical protein